MGLLVEVKFENGKVSYLHETEQQKETLRLLKQFVAAHEGTTCYKLFLDKEEISFHKKLPQYYRTVMLQPLFEQMKDEYGLSNLNELDAVLSESFLAKEITKKNGETKKIALRIDNVPYDQQVAFISKVATVAATKYQIKFPNANEIGK